MKIASVVLNGNFTDGMAYQENCLPYYQKIVFNADVVIISGQYQLIKGTNGSEIVPTCNMLLDNGVRLRRIKSFSNRMMKKMAYYPDLYDVLCEEQPDVIFAHLFQSLSLNAIVKYKKTHPNVKIFADSHADHVNSANNMFSSKILHGIVWKHLIQRAMPYIEKVYGVLPARVEFLKEMYSVPNEKTELLLMGAEDEKIHFDKRDNIRHDIRKQYSLQDDDFVLISGGKLDERKRINLIVDSIEKMQGVNLKLFLFGEPTDELKEYITDIQRRDEIIYLGWLSPEEMYRYFHASDLAVFPGTHSVIWEQAIGAGLPGVFKKWNGITHVDLGGNVRFLQENSADELTVILRQIIKFDYNIMKEIALENRKKFLYSEIAFNSITR